MLAATAGLSGTPGRLNSGLAVGLAGVNLNALLFINELMHSGT
jgi:hypothetical protein